MVLAETEWRSRIIGSDRVDPRTLAANPRNWRTHPENQRVTLLALIREVGVVQRILVNKPTGFVLDGHLRVALAIQDNQPWVEIEYLDLSEEEELKVLALFDPITGMADANRAKIQELADLIHFQNDRLRIAFEEEAKRFRVNLGKAAASANDPGANVDAAEELVEKWKVEPGQIWEIPSKSFPGASHRLLCGDATDSRSRDALLGQMRPALLHTDPPYGVNIVSQKPRNGRAATINSERRNPTGFSRGKVIQSNVYTPIRGDLGPFNPAFLLKLAPIVILWGANYYAHDLPISPCWIVWDKREGITRNTMADCELAWCSKKAPARVFHHLWNGLHKGSQHGEKRTHPAEKPVALFEEIGKLYAPQGVWLDLYAGTGAQLVAAERVGTVCVAVEIEPTYCAVILERLKGLGLEPVKMTTIRQPATPHQSAMDDFLGEPGYDAATGT